MPVKAEFRRISSQIRCQPAVLLQNRSPMPQRPTSQHPPPPPIFRAAPPHPTPHPPPLLRPPHQRWRKLGVPTPCPPPHHPSTTPPSPQPPLPPNPPHPGFADRGTVRCLSGLAPVIFSVVVSLIVFILGFRRNHFVRHNYNEAQSCSLVTTCLNSRLSQGSAR